MSTAEHDRALDIAVRSMDSDTFAYLVIMERMRSLSKDDQRDLFELSCEHVVAESAEIQADIKRTMGEILRQIPLRVRELPLAEAPGPKLQKWIDDIGVKIRKARKEAKLTQPQLAEASGVPQSYISRVENGKLSPSHVAVEKLAKALGKPTGFFDPSAD